MRSKKKNKKRKSAYRKGERTAIFLKKGTIVLTGMVVLSLAVLAVKMIDRKFIMQQIVLTGNYHLGRDDILRIIKTEKGALMSGIDLEILGGKLTDNPWIKSASVRKQYPDTLMVKIREATPAALMKIKKNLYLVDRGGELLEKVMDSSTNFLPVIRNIKPDDKKALTEALKLVAVLFENRTFADRESVEIGLETYGLTMRIDGEFIKVGYGRYADKFGRWMELEPEIRRKGVPIKYVDLRFKDSVIVKPLTVNKRKSS